MEPVCDVENKFVEMLSDRVVLWCEDCGMWKRWHTQRASCFHIRRLSTQPSITRKLGVL